MNLGRFCDILDAYGAAPERWPQSEREAALALLRSSVPAARQFARARALDQLMAAALMSASPGPGRLERLRARILDATAARPAAGRLGLWLGFDAPPFRIWPSVAGLAFATILGFAVGLAGLLQQDADRDGDDTTGWAITDIALAGP